MDFKKIVIASLIYIIWSVLIGYFVPLIATWATIIAALAAGIYAGHKAKTGEGFSDGLLAGLIGGIVGSVIITYVPNFYGIPMKISTSEFLGSTLELIQFSFPWILNLDLVLIGSIFGGIGGFLGSKEKLKSVFLFLILFLLFIFFGGVDNAAWNIFKTNWSWNMSISHVLTNRIDLFVAVVFSAFITFLYYFLNLHEKKEKINSTRKINFEKIIFSSIIFMIWSVLIGYFISYLIPYAVIIAAISAGIYAGFRDVKYMAITNGFIAGLCGGLALGIVSIYIPNIAGIPLSVSIAVFLTPMINIVTTTIPWFIIPSLAIIGSIFGAFGGLIGSIEKLKNILLFLTLFTLFIFYLALDNVAWWWGRAEWNWSISLVLMHWVDISMAFLFSILIMFIYKILKV